MKPELSSHHTLLRITDQRSAIKKAQDNSKAINDPIDAEIRKKYFTLFGKDINDTFDEVMLGDQYIAGMSDDEFNSILDEPLIVSINEAKREDIDGYVLLLEVEIQNEEDEEELQYKTVTIIMLKMLLEGKILSEDNYDEILDRVDTSPVFSASSLDRFDKILLINNILAALEHVGFIRSANP